jgi:hypothetical protein
LLKVLRRGCALDPQQFLERFGFERVLTRGQASLSNAAFPVSSFGFVSPVHPSNEQGRINLSRPSGGEVCLLLPARHHASNVNGSPAGY